MTGDVLEAVPRNLFEIEMLLVRDTNGKVWEFATEGPIGIDAAHLLVHRDIGAGVEVIYLENGSKAGIGTRLKKLQSSARTSGPTPVSRLRSKTVREW